MLTLKLRHQYFHLTYDIHIVIAILSNFNKFVYLFTHLIIT